MPFHTTRWSLVARSGASTPERRAALAELCEAYWPPVYAFFRRAGESVADAEDLTQGLFATLLARNDLAAADPSRGRFRNWLLACARHHLADVRAAGAARKRGGGRIVSLDAAAEAAVEEPADAQATPEEAFSRRWVRALIDRVLAALATEFEQRGRARVFAAARPWLLGEDADQPMRAAAAAIGTSEGAFKVAVHRLRARCQELLLAEVRHTVWDPADAADEVAQLLLLLDRTRKPDPR